MFLFLDAAHDTASSNRNNSYNPCSKRKVGISKDEGESYCQISNSYVVVYTEFDLSLHLVDRPTSDLPVVKPKSKTNEAEKQG